MAPERWLRMLATVGLLVALYFVVPVSTDPHGGLPLRVGLAVLVLLVLAVVLGRQLVRHARDLDRHVDGLVAAIVVVLVVFALGYFILELHRPGQVTDVRTRLDALYLSAATMLTIGYGDAHPAGQAARALALVQMVFDVVFVAAAVRLLTRRVGGRPRLSAGDDAAEPHV